jgi:hypothetical protein
MMTNIVKSAVERALAINRKERQAIGPAAPRLQITSANAAATRQDSVQNGKEREPAPLQRQNAYIAGRPVRKPLATLSGESFQPQMSSTVVDVGSMGGHVVRQPSLSHSPVTLADQR